MKQALIYFGILFAFFTFILVGTDAKAGKKCTLLDDSVMCMDKKAFEHFAKVLLKEMQYPTGAIEYMVDNGTPCDSYKKGEIVGYVDTKPCVLERPSGETVTVDCVIVSTENIGRKTTYKSDYWILKKNVKCS